MDSRKRYHLVMIMLVLVLMAGIGYYCWSIYQLQEAPKDGILVEAVQRCLNV